jgi:hypothetical protein
MTAQTDYYTSHFEDWSRNDDGVSLLKTTLQERDTTPVDVHKACERAADIVNDTWATKNQYAIPLFETDAPRPNGYYVRYKPDQEKIQYYNADKGHMHTIPVDQLTTTNIAHHLKWWLPNHNDTIDTLDDDLLPPNTIHATDPIATDDSTTLFDDIRSVVETERDAELEQNRSQFTSLDTSRPAHTQALKGPLIPLGNGHADTFTLALTTTKDEYGTEPDTDHELDLRDDAGIFEGNRYLAVVNDDNVDPVEVVADRVHTQRLELAAADDHVTPTSPTGSQLTDPSNTVWLYLLLNPTPYTRRLTAINNVADHHEKRQLLTGDAPIEFTPNEYAAPSTSIELNDSQERALIWADAATDCVCIHGPPGTGKTRTLTAVIEAAVDAGQTVLVTAHSNQAVDNLLVGDSTPTDPEIDTLHEIASRDDTDLTIARHGSHSQNRVVQLNYTDTSTKKADVVAATTNGAASFDTGTFDVAVLDEATQASRAASLIAFDAADQLVLAGDHRQLPPFSAGGDSDVNELRPSLFETLLTQYGDDLAVMLNTQYRMHEAIAAFPSEQFYDGSLETASRNADWTIEDFAPLLGIDMAGTERTPENGTSKYNLDEADAAARQVQQLLAAGVDPSDIGVISAYSRQVTEIQRRIGGLDEYTASGVQVDTVDSFQGSEREVIIVSLVRSNKNNQSGFLTLPEEGPRRLNVALTRARKRLVVLGDFETLGTVADGKAGCDSCAGLYEELAATIDEHGRLFHQHR